MEQTDVVVIGAGVAGLAAARELWAKDHGVLVIEARDRIGGRILTHTETGVPMPIELGAEFVHGRAPETRRLLREASLVAWDIDGDSWQARRGRLTSRNTRRTIDRVLRLIDTDRPDESLAAFLARRPGGRRLARARVATRQFVQGFHAADPDDVSAHSLAPAGSARPSEGVSRSARIGRGYARLAEWLARELAGEIRLRTTAWELAWEPGRVELTVAKAGRSSRLEARAAVVTVPLGTLKAPPGGPGSLPLRPEPPRIRQAVDRLAMGSALRITFRFRELPWMTLPRRRADGSLDRLSFLRTETGPFRVWWTAYPAEFPLVVAWSGGPAATLARGDPGEVADRALRGLARDLGTSQGRLDSLVEGYWTHDWDGDPLASGAYAYARVGGAEASALLARPVRRTLFFAGEATDGSQLGTVEGAIASGRRAARLVDLALRRE